MKLKYQVSPLYWKFWPKELLELDPQETKATCGDCAMSPGKKPRLKKSVSYEADLKCCTFHPWIPNFQVGAILREKPRDDQPEMQSARQVILNKIERREYSLPVGLPAPIRYQMEFNARSAKDFGNREEWLCPYYFRKTGRCGVWRHRGAVCTSFHCVSDQGKAGLEFWVELEDFHSYVEMALMEEALVHLDFSPRQVSDLLGYLKRDAATAAETKSWVLPEKKARLLWNGYFEEQPLFFEKSLRVVEGFSNRDFQEALGETGSRLQERVLAASGCFQ